MMKWIEGPVALRGRLGPSNYISRHYESRSLSGQPARGRQLDSMERATDRLRRIITTVLAAVVWKQHGAAHVPRTFDTGR
jgi:hypothetical protein